MIKFKRVIIQNFMSYGNVPTVVDLDLPGTTLILGEDLDNTSVGVGNNGVGKTTIINALTYGLYDRPISKINLDNLVNHINKKNMRVTVEFEKDGKEYSITRTRKASYGADARTIEFLIDGEDKTQSIDNTNALIVQELGIPYEVFVRVVTFSANLIPFLDLPSRHASQANQTDIIEELFDLKTLSEKAELLRKKITDSERSLETNLNHIEQLKKEHERHEKQIQFVNDRMKAWDEETESNLHKNKKSLAELRAIDTEQQQTLFAQVEEVRAKLKEKQSQHRELVATETARKSELRSEQSQGESIYSNRNTELKGIKTQIVTINKEIKTLKDTLAELELAKDKLLENKCPYCAQEFKDTKAKIKEVDTKVHQTQKKLEKVNENLDEHADQFSTKEIEVKEAQNEVKSISEKVNDLERESRQILNASQREIDVLEKQEEDLSKNLEVNTLEDLQEIQRQISSTEEKIADLEGAVNPHVDTLTEMQSQELEAIDMEIINNLTKLIEHQKFLLKLLTKKDSFVRKALLNKNIPFLNGRLAHYLTDLGLPHKVEFTHEMTCAITQFDRPMDFGNLSNGQRARVNIALSFAFRDVLQSLHQKINVCMLDEVLDVGLDSVGVQAAARMLKQKARNEGLSLFIISHREEIDSAFDRKLMVQMTGGFSSIKEG